MVAQIAEMLYILPECLGAGNLVIRPFQLGDLLLVQRLGYQAAKLNIIQSLLQPRPALTIALGAVLPWAGGNANTYVLRQQKNSLAHAGFIQAHRRTGRAEADITFLAPALDTPRGHPAIWEKLLTHYVHEAASQKIYRIYADVPDQPLPVHSFTQSGFKIYTRQTIWRFNRHNSSMVEEAADKLLGDKSSSESSIDSIFTIRPLMKQDEWALLRLYDRITPKDVQHAEGIQQQAFEAPRSNGHAHGNGSNHVERGSQRHVKPPILDWWQSSHSQTYVITKRGEIEGAILIGGGPSGTWLRLLADTTKPDTEHIRRLLRYGLGVINDRQMNQPIYVGVRSYHGGLAAILDEHGFAPFTDLARMVRQVPVWIRTPVFTEQRILDAVHSPVPTTYISSHDAYLPIEDCFQHHSPRVPQFFFPNKEGNALRQDLTKASQS